MTKKITQRISIILGSKKFFAAFIILFAVQALWMAINVQYPMAFDESYHFGIIQIYSHQWSPFISTLSEHYTSGYGDLTRYDSYLYHYLMSFPLRLIALFTDAQVVQIILLRLINIAIFITGLFMFRRLFRQVHISDRLTNFALLALTLIPTVPFLAATINYDNLVFLMVAVVTSLAITCSNAITKHRRLPATSFLLLLTLGSLATLVKYAFAPVIAAIMIYLLVLVIRTPSKAGLWLSLVGSFKSLDRGLQVGLVVAVLLGGGLFVERYGVNLVQYHSLAPDCSDVQELPSCLQYGPWGRNYQLATNVKANNPPLDPPIAKFPQVWTGDMLYRLYFAIDRNFKEYPPLLIPVLVAGVVGLSGIVLSLVYWRSILATDRHLLLFMAIAGLYLLSLLYDNFSEYLQYHTLVAVNGRYAIVILPLVLVWLGLAYRRFFTTIFKVQTKVAVPLASALLILLLLQGGGVADFLVNSQTSDYWDNQTVVDINLGLQKVATPFVLGR